MLEGRYRDVTRVLMWCYRGVIGPLYGWYWQSIRLSYVCVRAVTRILLTRAIHMFYIWTYIYARKLARG